MKTDDYRKAEKIMQEVDMWRHLLASVNTVENKLTEGIEEALFTVFLNDSTYGTMPTERRGRFEKFMVSAVSDACSIAKKNLETTINKVVHSLETELKEI